MSSTYEFKFSNHSEITQHSSLFLSIGFDLMLIGKLYVYMKFYLSSNKIQVRKQAKP